jgi:hypothetical protein
MTVESLLNTLLSNPASGWACVAKFLPRHYQILSDRRWRLHMVLLSMDFQNADQQELLQALSSETQTDRKETLNIVKTK